MSRVSGIFGAIAAAVGLGGLVGRPGQQPPLRLADVPYLGLLERDGPKPHRDREAKRRRRKRSAERRARRGY